MFQFMIPEQVREFQTRSSVRIIRPERVEVLPKGSYWPTVEKRSIWEGFEALGFVLWMLPLIGAIVAFAYALATGQTSFLNSVPVLIGINLFMIWVYITMGAAALIVIGFFGYLAFAAIRFLATGKPIFD